MLKNVPLSIFLLVYIGFSLIFHQAPLLSWLNRFTDFSTISGLSALLFIELLSFSLWILLLTPFFIISIKLGKLIAVILLILNATALFWMTSLGVVMTKAVIASLFFTDYSEASGFLNDDYMLHLVLLGILPSIVVVLVPIAPVKRRVLCLYPILSVALIFTATSLAPNLTSWVNANGAQLGSRLLPWSYIGKTINYVRDLRSGYYGRYFGEFAQLPDGVIADDTPGLVVLVIGESSRGASYSYYGYERAVNTSTQDMSYVALPISTACATSTMITTGCILSPHGRDDWEKEPVEPLPSYLHRLGIKTFVRTNNTEMPRLKVGDYKTTEELAELCETDYCKAYNARSCQNQLCQESYFDNMLLANMDPILDLAQQEKIFLLLHLRGSHGPNYADRSPKEFRPFTPACDDHVTKCSLETLTNSYDNSTAFTDQILANLAKTIAQRQNLNAAVLYLSDHGQSLGEDGLYMHGLPIDEAPIEQLEIPFLLWTSETLKKTHDISQVVNTNVAAQDAIFHSVLGLLNVIDGPYDPQRDIFQVR